MPSRLSSLLVRDGLVGVKRMEKAFQRQVIYGGTLDTILLEMNLVPEDRLTQYLALASGLPPAARHEGTVLSPAATAHITRELAEKHRAVPLGMEKDAIRVLVCSPLELSALEDLADLLDRPLQPLIAPEYRWHLVFAAAYALDPPARFTTLARQLDVDAPTPPVGRGSSIIVDAGDGTGDGPWIPRTQTQPGIGQPYVPPAPVPVPATTKAPAATALAPTIPQAIPQAIPSIDSGVVLAPIAADEKTLKIASLGRQPAEIVPEPEGAAGSGRSHRDTIIGVEPNRAVTDPKPPERPTPLPIALTMLEPVITRPRAPGNSLKKKPLRATEPAVDLGGDTPIAIVRAREILAAAPDRDAVFKALLRATRSRARYAGLLSVQGGNAVGRIALGEAGIDVAGIASVAIPLEPASAFRQVVESQQPHVGKIHAGDPVIDLQTRRFGGTTPTSALLLPVVLRGRVVAIIVAHRLTHDIRLADVTELLPLASATADALSRLIVKAKAAGYRAPTEPPPAAAIVPEVPAAPAGDGAWATPAGPITPVSLPAVPDRDLAYTQQPDRPIDEVLDEIENAAEGHSEDAIADAVERSTEALGALMRRFPGKLRVDRFSVTGRALRAAQYGGMLELVVRLGSVVAELLVEKMAAPQRDVRFYATVCAAELRPRSAVYALVERVFDQDYGVRAMAIEALSGYPIGDLGNAMARARRAVRSVDPEVVLAATSAIVELGDIEAIGDLIRVVETSGRSGEAARKGLIALTAQDFGSSERKWRKWWEGAKGKHRIEWLIDGLTHKDDDVRATSIAELRRMTGEYFGYHHDLPRRERDLAAERWAGWWRESGQRRFVARDDERARPTAVLPARRGTD